MARIGVYVCECGPNIGRSLDLTALERFARKLDGVVRVGRASVLCSPEGRAYLAEEIAAHLLERVVVAGCSPGEHEFPFHGVLKRAGLNPFFLRRLKKRFDVEGIEIPFPHVTLYMGQGKEGGCTAPAGQDAGAGFRDPRCHHGLNG